LLPADELSPLLPPPIRYRPSTTVLFSLDAAALEELARGGPSARERAALAGGSGVVLYQKRPLGGLREEGVGGVAEAEAEAEVEASSVAVAASAAAAAAPSPTSCCSGGKNL
jgi:hypothetical protein